MDIPAGRGTAPAGTPGTRGASDAASAAAESRECRGGITQPKKPSEAGTKAKGVDAVEMGTRTRRGGEPAGLAVATRGTLRVRHSQVEVASQRRDLDNVARRQRRLAIELTPTQLRESFLELGRSGSICSEANQVQRARAWRTAAAVPAGTAQ